MNSKVVDSIVKTLVYADVFDYPLKFDELFRFLISGKKITKNLLLANLLDLLPKRVEKKENFFFFKGREETVYIRKRRQIHSKRKIDLAKRVIFYLSLVPSLQFIGISGALAMKNSEKDDDVDLFIITARKKLWLTRFLCLCLLRIIGKARKRNEKDVSDKICVNMFLSELQLSLPSRWHNIYGAHEVVQMLPLFDRDNAYRKFLNANSWVSKFLPNVLTHRTKGINRLNHTESFFSVILRLALRLPALEYFAKTVQLWYMKGHRTRELISDTLLAFHPIDYREKVLVKYQKRLKRYKLT